MSTETGTYHFARYHIHCYEVTICDLIRFISKLQTAHSGTKINNMDKFELHQEIGGKNAMEFMADLLVKNEKQSIEIERGKLQVAILKQMNNRSRLLLDAQKFELEASQVKDGK